MSLPPPPPLGGCGAFYVVGASLFPGSGGLQCVYWPEARCVAFDMYRISLECVRSRPRHFRMCLMPPVSQRHGGWRKGQVPTRRAADPRQVQPVRVSGKAQSDPTSALARTARRTDRTRSERYGPGSVTTITHAPSHEELSQEESGRTLCFGLDRGAVRDHGHSATPGPRAASSGCKHPGELPS